MNKETYILRSFGLGKFIINNTRYWRPDMERADLSSFLFCFIGIYKNENHSADSHTHRVLTESFIDD
jgi:hypothetical protein